MKRNTELYDRVFKSNRIGFRWQKWLLTTTFKKAIQPVDKKSAKNDEVKIGCQTTVLLCALSVAKLDKSKLDEVGASLLLFL